MFNVGDYIIMKRGSPYGITKYKSTGVVIAVNDVEVLVEYDYVTGPPSLDGITSFWVEKTFCKVTKQLSPQEKVCAKIKQMEARWLKFQERKSCHV